MRTIQAIRDAGVSVNQALVLGHLFKTPGMRTRELATKLDASYSLVNQLLTLLRKRHYLRSETKQDPANSHRHIPHNHHYLTSKGHHLANQFNYE